MKLFRATIGAIKKGLDRTREGFVGGLRSLLRGRKLDEALLSALEKQMIEGDLGVRTTGRLMAELRRAYKEREIETGDQVLEFLKHDLIAMWPPADRELNLAVDGPSVILVTGVNGVGKTTSIAKLARLLQLQNKTVLLGACDTFRAGAVRQLEIWAERLGVDIVKGQQGGDPAAVAFDACQAGKARGVDVVILDTAGRLQTQDPLMRQLTKIRGVVAKHIEGGPHEVLLVLDATSGQNALRQAEAFGESAGVTGIMLTKLDGTAKGGIVVAIRESTDIPVKFIGVGETPEDIQPFEPEVFVEALFSE